MLTYFCVSDLIAEGHMMVILTTFTNHWMLYFLLHVNTKKEKE